MKTWIVSALAVLLVGSTQLSCSVNDYCLGCENGDAGNDGNGSGGIDASIDAAPDAGCVPSGPEECDGKDNNCDGLVDNGSLPGVGDPCTNQNGACAGGILECTSGALKCNKVPSPETCNGVDDNCNGTPDEGNPGGGGTCGTDQGACVAGQLACDPLSGTVKCFGVVDKTGSTEACNQIDDDCDVKIDEAVPSAGACGPIALDMIGQCRKGSLECKPGGVTTCDGAVFPAFETCNNADDDCDSFTDEIFNKQTDTKNCGACGMVCPARANANTTCASGVCSFACKPGYKDLNNSASDGCEFGPCFATGVEECDGADNDCDNMIDEDLMPPAICLGGGECGVTAPIAKCMGNMGWTCTYLGDVQFPETKCDGKDNNCDGNIDENQPNKNQTCNEDSETVCSGNADDDVDGSVNDGCPPAGPNNSPETGTACADTVDSDGDGIVNDGCPAVARQGACRGTGTYQCDTRPTGDLNGAAICVITQPGQAVPAAGESCDFKDNDCDGGVDEGGNTGNLVGQDWVDISNNRQMMKYEASRPDATDTAIGTAGSTVCSRPDVQPWTNIKYPDAVAACASIGATLCSEQEWHRTCSAVTTMPTYPIAFNGTATYIDAESYSSIAPGATASWVADYTSGYTGISDMEASPNLGTSVSTVNAVAEAARLSYSMNFTAGTYYVYVKLYSNNGNDDTVHVGIGAGAPTATVVTTINNAWRWYQTGPYTVSAGIQNVNVFMGDDGVKIDRIYLSSSSSATPGTGEPASSAGNTWAYATNGNTYNTDTCNGHDYRTVNVTSAARASSGVVTVTVASHPFVVGDRVQIQGSSQATFDGVYTITTTTATSFTYTQTSNTVQSSTGGTATEARDPVLKTGGLTSCYAPIGTGVFDMSGNVREWTLAHTTGENPIKGGASNGTATGISCALNFTLGTDTFFFPNVGFRCCRPKP